MVLVTTCLVVLPAVAEAQIYEAVGTRAQGMGGAFVAVANDATATWWNPAGIASGAYLSLLFEQGRLDDPGKAPAFGPATRDTETAFAFAVPSMGLSYYRLRISEIGTMSPTETVGEDREDQGVDLRALAVSQYGLTVGQSVGQGFALASTFKLVRAGVSSSRGQPVDGLDQAQDLDVSVANKSDLDIGAMISAGSLRVGFSVKHLFQPEFETEESSFVMERQARIGVAYLTSGPGSIDGVTVAFDADLTSTPTAFGDVRHIAAGAEWLGRWVGIRGGLSKNTVGDLETAASAGASVGLGSGLHVDGAWTFGDDDSKKGWKLGGRLTF